MNKEMRSIFMYDMGIEERWERPFTAKRYLHGPFSEYMYTLWADLKVLCGFVEEKTHGYRSSAFRILRGAALREPDFRKTRSIARDDGIPIHALSYDYGDLVLHMEAFCDTGTRVPSVYTKLTITSNSHEPITDQLALLPRTGREDHLVGMEVDGYAHFDSNVHNFGFLPSKWRRDGESRLTDGEYEILSEKTMGFRRNGKPKKRGLFGISAICCSCALNWTPPKQKRLRSGCVRAPTRPEPFPIGWNMKRACNSGMHNWGKSVGCRPLKGIRRSSGTSFCNACKCLPIRRERIVFTRGRGAFSVSSGDGGFLSS
jgi:hypothetical protein